MKNWGNGKRLSNAAVSCLFDLLLIHLNSSSYSLTKPLILSSFGQSQVWSCNFLSWKGISGVRLASREWFLEIYSWHLRKFNFFQQSSSNTLWSQGLCESILKRKESKEAQVQFCILRCSAARDSPAFSRVLHVGVAFCALLWHTGAQIVPALFFLLAWLVH